MSSFGIPAIKIARLLTYTLAIYIMLLCCGSCDVMTTWCRFACVWTRPSANYLWIYQDERLLACVLGVW